MISTISTKNEVIDQIDQIDKSDQKSIESTKIEIGTQQIRIIEKNCKHLSY